jgi:hypothetical protein
MERNRFSTDAIMTRLAADHEEANSLRLPILHA